MEDRGRDREAGKGWKRENCEKREKELEIKGIKARGKEG